MSLYLLHPNRMRNQTVLFEDMNQAETGGAALRLRIVCFPKKVDTEIVVHESVAVEFYVLHAAVIAEFLY
jgi:hypothetical protein